MSLFGRLPIIILQKFGFIVAIQMFSFEQYHEDADYFYIRKDGTNMNLRIPKKEGWLQISYENASSWENLYFTASF